MGRLFSEKCLSCDNGVSVPLGCLKEIILVCRAHQVSTHTISTAPPGAMGKAYYSTGTYVQDAHAVEKYPDYKKTTR